MRESAIAVLPPSDKDREQCATLIRVLFDAAAIGEHCEYYGSRCIVDAINARNAIVRIRAPRERKAD